MKQKNSNIVTKIALIVAIIALIFSIVTLVRAIIINAGIVLAIVQVVGTAIIVVICSIMLYVLSNSEEEEDDEEEEESEQPEAVKEPVEEEAEIPAGDIDVDLSDIEKTDDSKYDLSNFEA